MRNFIVRFIKTFVVFVRIHDSLRSSPLSLVFWQNLWGKAIPQNPAKSGSHNSISETHNSILESSIASKSLCTLFSDFCFHHTCLVIVSYFVTASLFLQFKFFASWIARINV